MITAPTLAVLALAALLAGAAPTQPLTFDRPETRTSGPALEVSSTTFPAGGVIPMANSGYGKNHSPSVQWSQGPERTRSYVLIVEDADASLDGARPLLHWLAYDLAADATNVRDKSRNLKHVTEPMVFDQGVNDHGGLGWTGPHPPVGDPAHHYHFQVFALDRKTVASPGATFDRVLRDMAGHVLAKGQTTGLYAQLPDKVRKVKGKDGKLTEAAPAG